MLSAACAFSCLCCSAWFLYCDRLHVLSLFVSCAWLLVVPSCAHVRFVAVGVAHVHCFRVLFSILLVSAWLKAYRLSYFGSLLYQPPPSSSGSIVMMSQVSGVRPSLSSVRGPWGLSRPVLGAVAATGCCSPDPLREALGADTCVTIISENDLRDEGVTIVKKLTTPAVRRHLVCGPICGASHAACLVQISRTHRWRQ